MEKAITLIVNGESRTVTTDPARSLLDVVREDLELTGAKAGCGEGRCGACTVLVDGSPVHSCITPVGDVAGKEVVTIEGLARGEELHPVQEAFVAERAMQCGYCTPGMILGTVGLLSRNSAPSEPEILAAMEGHICRCASYPRIVQAIKRAANHRKGE
jgi:aerobic-type carbon monoxide dehydrogenase small subunit (CoxS/CutS family)